MQFAVFLSLIYCGASPKGDSSGGVALLDSLRSGLHGSQDQAVSSVNGGCCRPPFTSDGGGNRVSSRLDLERPVAAPDGHPGLQYKQASLSVHSAAHSRVSSGAVTSTAATHHRPAPAASAMPGCYVGKATKIFLALLALLAVVGVVLAFRTVLHRSARSSPSSATGTPCAAADECQPVLPGPALAQPATAARPTPTPTTAPPQNPTFPSPDTAWPPPSPVPVTPLQPPPSPMLVPPPQLPPPAAAVPPPLAFPSPPPPAEIASPPPASATPPPPADLLPPPPALPSPTPPAAPEAPSPTAS